ncbi:MAG: TIGR03546 family protein [Ignavibacteria bacterium]|nr:TIGR03546 family protein [Ignavibacteria bacterium]
MFTIKFLAKLFSILRSGASPAQISWGIVFGMIMGLTPVLSLHNLVLVFLMIIFEINISMALFSMAIFSGIAYIFDPYFHSLGYYILVDVGSMQETWNNFYNIPILALSRFNNTIVMGSLAASLALVIPVFFLGKQFVVVYRTKVDPYVEKWKVMKMIKSSKFYEIYTKISEWRG